MIDTGRLFIIGVIALISFLAYSSQFFIFWDFLGGFNVQCLMVLIPFNISVLLTFYNYYMTCKTDPGRVPKDWCPKEDQEDIEIKRTTHAPRYCRTCSAFKPPRSHHCRTCKRCVLKMDHHCPWTNNCVGYFNYGHFIRFVFWVDVACIYHFILMIKRTMEIINDMSMVRFDKEPTTTEMIFIVLNYAAGVPVLFSVGILSIYHFYCMWSNTTTIENWEKDKVSTMVRRGKIKEMVFPYDIGILENIKAILGDNPLLWCWPQQIKGNGLSFPISSDADPTLIWPPKDPTAKAASQLPPKPWELYNLNHNQFDRTNRSQKFSNPVSSHRRNRQYRHVRRDSEGYLVRDLSLEERAMLVEDHGHQINHYDDDNYYGENGHTNLSDGSTLYSSSDEFSNGEQLDDFDDANYPQHVGIGNDERTIRNSKHHYQIYDRARYRKDDDDDVRDDDSDENVPLGMIIGKRQSDETNYESGFSETRLKASSHNNDTVNSDASGNKSNAHVVDKIEKVD